MHSALNLIFLTRDKDLCRWGRISAFIMILLGLFLLCAVIYSYHLLVDSLEPTMRLSQELDQKLIAKITSVQLSESLILIFCYQIKVFAAL